MGWVVAGPKRKKNGKLNRLVHRKIVDCSGIYVLLNLLERGHSSVQPQVLSLVGDMIRMNPGACDHIHSWRSPYTNRTALQVLLHIWRDAEADWGVCTNGVLNSVTKPLAGIGRRNLWIPKHEVCKACIQYFREATSDKLRSTQTRTNLPPSAEEAACICASGLKCLVALRPESTASVHTNSQACACCAYTHTSFHWRVVLQVVYGCLTDKRKQELRTLCNAVSTEQKMRKIYSVLNFLGFSSWGEDLCAHDRATLTLIEKYVKFKQGEVWMEIETKFNTCGFRPTGSDRARLQSGIQFSEHLATIVTKDQTRLLISEQHEQGKKERERLAAKLVQAQLEYDIKFYKRDKSQVTAKEKSAARAKRDEMLATSRENASRQLAGNLASTLVQEDLGLLNSSLALEAEA